MCDSDFSRAVALPTRSDRQSGRSKSGGKYKEDSDDSFQDDASTGEAYEFEDAGVPVEVVGEFHVLF